MFQTRIIGFLMLLIKSKDSKWVKTHWISFNFKETNIVATSFEDY